MPRMTLPILAAVALLGLPAVAVAQQEMAHDDHEMEMDHEAMSAEVTEAIDAQTAAMAEAWSSGDAAAVAAFYAEDAVAMPPASAALEGRAAIQQYMRAGFAQMQGAKMSFETKEIRAMHHHAVQVGSYVLEAADGSHVDHGKYMTVWGETDEGWQIVRDIWNSSMGGGQ